MVTATEALSEASTALEERRGLLNLLTGYLEGKQAGTFLSPSAVKATQGRLRELPVNVIRTAVDTIGERLTVQGFTADDDGSAWAIWRQSGMLTGAPAVHGEALAFGCGYVSSWVDQRTGRPRLCAESPACTWLDLDPVSGEPVLGVKRWYDKRAKRGRALVFTEDTVTRLTTASEIPAGAGLPADGWVVVSTEPNTLRAVPISYLPNRPRSDRPFGEPEISDLLGLADALAKLTQDLLVTSESYSRPRRWVAGLEVVTEPRRNDDGTVVLDGDGEPIEDPINPFSETVDRVWQSEDAETKFGEFSPASLAGFEQATGIILRELAAVSGLPPSLLGLSNDQPASADALRASEVGLVTKVRQRAATYGEGWARAMRLARIIETGADRPAFDDIAPIWENFESRSEIVAADRASKLHAIGVPLEAILADLDWSPADIRRVLDARRAEALDSLGADVAAVIK